MDNATINYGPNSVWGVPVPGVSMTPQGMAQSQTPMFDDFSPPSPEVSATTPLSGNGGVCPPGIVSTFSTSPTGIGATMSKYPTLMAQRLNLNMWDVQNTIQEGIAAGPIPTFSL